MKVAILTCSTENRKWLYTITNTTKEKYCNKFNYDYIFCDNFYPDINRHAYWNKISFIIKYIDNYDYIIWMDDDAGFINFDKSLNDILQYDFAYCNDMNDFNAGVMIFKCTPENKKILEFIWNVMYEKYKFNKFPEQDALKKIFIDDLQKGTLIDGHLYNAYDKSLTYSITNQANNNTIILHIAGGSEFKEKHKLEIKKLYEYN